MIWHDLTKLSRQGYECHRDRPLDDVLQDFRAASIQMLLLVEGMDENDIFTKGFYPWTRNSSLLTWIAANTYKHYCRARRQIRTTTIRESGIEGSLYLNLNP
jgi:hypothetical protein